MTTGLFRLWIVLSIAWLAFWATKVRDAYQALHVVQKMIGQYVPKKRAGLFDKFLGGLGDASLQAANENLKEVVFYLLGGPVALAFICFAIGWVTSGFRGSEEAEAKEQERQRDRHEPNLSSSRDIRF